MKKNEKKNEPGLELRVLDESELSLVSGAMARAQMLSSDCTCGTVSVCHIDGNDEGGTS